jgi:hypothetical protein
MHVCHECMVIPMRLHNPPLHQLIAIHLSSRLDLPLSEELVLLADSLPVGVTSLGSSVDELELDLFEVVSGSHGSEGVSKSDDPLSGTGDGTLEHDKVVLDIRVSRPTTEGVDVLLRDVEIGRGVLGVRARSDSVDLLVHFGSLMVTVLTRSSNREHDVGRMPSTDTGDLSETSMSLSGKLLGTPSSGDTFVTVTLGDGNDIDDLVLLEDGGNLNLLFEVGSGKLDLVGNRSTVDLDLHEVGLLLLETGLGELGVAEDSNDGTVLLDSLHLSADRLAVVLRELLGVSGEGLLLGSVPVPACQ